MSWQSATTVVVLCVVCGCSSRKVRAQAPTVPELLQPVRNDELVNVTPEQSARLERIRHLVTTQSLHVVRINQNALKGHRLTISIPDDGAFNLLKTGGEIRSPEDFNWLGAMQGTPGGNATLVERNGNLTGSMTSAAGLYQITPVGGGLHAVVKVDTRKMPPDEPPLSEPKK